MSNQSPCIVCTRMIDEPRPCANCLEWDVWANYVLSGIDQGTHIQERIVAVNEKYKPGSVSCA